MFFFLNWLQDVGGFRGEDKEDFLCLDLTIVHRSAHHHHHPHDVFILWYNI